MLPQEYYYWWRIYYFFKNDKKNLMKFVDSFISEYAEMGIDEEQFAVYFLLIYKNAYRGFWKNLAYLFKKYKIDNGEKLCNLFEDFYYNCKTDDEKENLLVNYIQDNPETILAKEFLGNFYYDKKLYYNAISMFEQVAGKSVFNFPEDIYFYLGYCYSDSKVREYSKSEENYRKCLEITPNYGTALNNLGFLLYKQ